MTLHRLFRRGLAVVKVVVVASLPVSGAEMKRLPGHLISPAAAGAATGRVSATRPLDLAIGLPLRDAPGLTNFLTQLYDPASPGFHRWVTSEAFTARFGPTAADYAAVTDFARSNRLTVIGTHPNRLLLNVRGAAADIEQAFHLTLRTYAHPHEPREYFAPDTEPTVDARLPVADVSGLSDFGRPRPLIRPRPLGVQANGTGSAGGAFIGNDFRAAYVPGTSLNGANQVVGLVQFDGFYASDITAYEAQAGLPNVPLQTVLLDGFNGTPTTGANSGNGEVSLDIEMVIAMAPGLAKIIVYEGNQNNFIPNDVLNRIATDNQARQISSSWSWTGGPSTTTDAILQQYAAQGQSYFAASGDSDAYTGANLLDAASSYTTPVDSPYVTSVGGTTLTTTGPGGAYVSETVWNWGNNAGSSGGVSTHYAIPSWQTGATLAGNQRSTTLRNIPDVALTADNVYVKYGNGLSAVFGGTSCAAPLWAGFTALVNQQAALAGQPPVGFLNPALYSLAESASYGTTFNDITTGNNIGTNTPGLYSAVAGYDLCTGWGTPAGIDLINALAPLAPTPVLAANGSTLLAESGAPANAAVDPGETVTMNFSLKNTGSAATTNLVATLLAGGGVVAPSGPQGYGVVAGVGGTASQAFTFTASGPCGGMLTAALHLQDGANDLGTLNFPVLLGAPTPAQRPVQNFDGVTSPALPAGWTSVNLIGTSTNWSTTKASKDTAPNAAFVPDITSMGENALVSPVITLLSSNAQLVFRHSYRLESSRSTYYDGGVLEIKVGSGAFTDILAAGGSFASNGYNGTLTSSSDNPIRGHQAWVGNGSTWRTVVINLPAAAAGQSVQLRWVLATDSRNSGTVTGWYVDSISLNDATTLCNPILADLGVKLSLSPDSVVAGQNLIYTLAVTNAGPQEATSVTVSDTFPPDLAFDSASPSAALFGNTVSWQLGTLPAGASRNLTVTFAPATAGPFTNSASVATVTPDPTVANNLDTLASTQGGPVSAGIASQPIDVAVVVGGTAVFQAAGNGTGPLGYQWYFNETNLLADATSSTLTLVNVRPEHEGGYAVVVSNAYGSATSAVAVLTVLMPPEILAQPLAQSVTGGSDVTFAVAATGAAPLAYQWYFNATNALPAATAPLLSLSNVQAAQAGNYSVVVTNACGLAISSNALLTVLLPPTIAAQPQGQAVALGTNATFSITATGTGPLSYQWYLNETNLLAGANTPTLTLTNVQPEQAGDYSVFITNAYGSISSKGATLTVLVPPAITEPPQDQIVVAGTNVTFTVAVSGTGPLAFQWFFNATNLLTGETDSTLTLTKVVPAQAGDYSVVVTNGVGSALSSAARLRVLVPPWLAPTNLQITATQAALTVPSLAGLNYTLEFTDSLAPAEWRPAAVAVPGTGGLIVLQDTNPPPVAGARYFRVRCD